MLKDPKVPVSQEEVKFNVRELEPLLAPPRSQIFKPWEPAYITLKNGQKMVIRELREEEAPKIMAHLKKVMEIPKDFYDIVGVRIYAELLGWLRNRLKDPYQMVGVTEDGVLAGFCNGRLLNDDINISLHSMAFRRGLRAGAIMYYAKCSYCFDYLGQEEFWATYESFNGFKRWGIGMAQPSYPWPDYQHELGGAKVFYITKEYWNTVVKRYLQDLVGATLVRPVPDDLLEKTKEFELPSEKEI